MQEKCVAFNKCNHIDCDKEYCVKKFRIEKLLDLTNLDKADRYDIPLWFDQDGTDSEEFHYLQATQKRIIPFVEQGGGLFIHSTGCGNGKSSWAKKLLREYIHQVWHKVPVDECCALYVNVPRFLLELKLNISQKSEYAEYVKNNIINADLVVFDEVGTKALTSFEFEHLLMIVEARVSAGKANIYTSNLSREDLLKTVGERLYSRIVNLSQDVEFRGADKRGLIK